MILNILFEKKIKVELFVIVFSFLYLFILEINKVVVFKGNVLEIKIVEENRGVFVERINLI